MACALCPSCIVNVEIRNPGTEGVYTLSQGINDESEHDEAEEVHGELLEAGYEEEFPAAAVYGQV